MNVPFLRSITLDSFLSFGPDAPEIPLTPLNVLIGPNASGKSNLLEAFEVLRATPTDLAAAVRIGGGPAAWLWKGEHHAPAPGTAKVTAILSAASDTPELRYRLEFTGTAQRLEIVDEALEETTPRRQDTDDVDFYFRFQRGNPAINTRAVPAGDGSARGQIRRLKREALDPQQSVFSQRRDPDLYPELTRVAEAFGRILTFREWSFGRSALLRQPQAADLPTDLLFPDLQNLGLVLNGIEHSDRWGDLNGYLRRFLPRFKHLSTRIQNGNVQIYLHEVGPGPVPATRLSDGTIRFIALLAILLRPEPASLICLEGPELGLHPDAIALTAELLVEASRRPQLIITTHSDVLVSALTEQADSVLVSECGPTGTMLRRLEAARLRFWLEKYRLGEIWRMGELGGNP